MIIALYTRQRLAVPVPYVKEVPYHRRAVSLFVCLNRSGNAHLC